MTDLVPNTNRLLPIDLNRSRNEHEVHINRLLIWRNVYRGRHEVRLPIYSLTPACPSRAPIHTYQRETQYNQALQFTWPVASRSR